MIAWTKFAKSESPTNILNWLGTIYPEPDTQPSYICIDKACQVLRTVVAQAGRWGRWRETTRFIVDSYHYINHKTTDTLCQKWCNPAPLDGSAPNLVEEEIGPDGETYKVSNFDIWTYFINDILFYRPEPSILRLVSSLTHGLVDLILFSSVWYPKTLTGFCMSCLSIMWNMF